MTDIISLLVCLDQCTDKTTLHRLSRIALAMLTMPGRVTMLGISRWTGKGGSYRTVQRLFNTTLSWANMLWLFVRHHFLDADGEYVIAGDETVVTKAGKATYGLDRFFSSLAGRPIPGLAFFGLSMIDVAARHSYPVMVEQRIRTKAEKQAAKAKQAAKKKKKAKETKGKPGRPKGSKNRDKTLVDWTPELLQIQRMLQKLAGLLGSFPVSYLVMDGHFGNNNAMQMVLQSTPWQLISKLRNDSSLYFQYDGPQKKKGPDRRYGDKIDYQAIPEKYLVNSATDKKFLTQTYQAVMLHKSFAQPLNVVIIVKVNLQTGARGHVVLFSSDLSLGYEKLVDYYVLRFQLEFNFRDAKQFWGLEDFMNVKQVPVTNAVNLAFFMVNLSHLLLSQMRKESPQAGILDLKADFRGRRYALETINLLPELPNHFVSDLIIRTVAALGRIHRHSDTPAIT